MLVPLRLPGSLYEALAFENGAAIGYKYGDGMGETPIQVVNRVYRDFCDELRRGGTYPWIVGYLLGCFTACIEQDRQLALVGMAHVCFLVSRLPDCTSAAFHRALSQIETFHNAVVRAYRAQVRTLREQGMSSAEAWQSALRPQWQAV